MKRSPSKTTKNTFNIVSLLGQCEIQCKHVQGTKRNKTCQNEAVDKKMPCFQKECTCAQMSPIRIFTFIIVSVYSVVLCDDALSPCRN